MIVARSLDTTRLSNESLTVTKHSGDDWSLAIASLDRPTRGTPIGIRVTVTDEQGAASSTEFSLTVLNDLPTVEIVEPSNYAIIAIPRGAEVVDVPVGVLINDDQPVEDVQLLLNSEVVEGAVVISRSLAGRFEATLSALRTGDYTLNASARDTATGELVLSSAVYMKVVIGGDGEIAIVHPEAETRDEIFAIWDYLVNLGLNPQVFLQEEILVEALAGFRAVIWHDLGSVELLDHTVEVLADLQDNVGTPIYYIGTELGSASSRLSSDHRQVWEELTRMKATGERRSVNQIKLHPSVLGARNQIEGSWALLDQIDLSFETDLVEVKEDAEILGTGDEEVPLIFRYPSSGELGTDEARRFVQLFSLRRDGRSEPGLSPASVFERQVLFANALCYLLEGPVQCECPSVALDVVAVDSPIDGKITARVAELFDVSLALSNNNGRCYLRQGKLIVPLPEGVELRGVDGTTEIPWEWDETGREAILSIGVLAPPADLDPTTGLPEEQAAPEGLEVNLRLHGRYPGVYSIEMLREANLVDPQPYGLELEIQGISLELQPGRGVGFSLVLRGSNGARGRVEQTTDLGASKSWTLLRQVEFTHSDAVEEILVEYTGEQRFFRVVEF